MSIGSRETELAESVSLSEASSEGFVSKPNGERIELGFDHEGKPSPGGIFDAQKRVPVHVIRPGIGKGRGRHLYEAKMLKENAHVFAGWKSYVDHLSPEARKAAGGLPRGVRDLGGRLTETWWDPNVPADPERGHGPGAVVGMARPVKWLREQIEDDPELVEASISASATGVKPIVKDGQRVWLVEGINPRGSLDFVTEAGAGGRIAPLLESAYSTEEQVEMALLESMSDDEMREYIANDRPDLVLNEAGNSTPEGGDDVADLTPEALQEALAANPNVLLEALQQSAEVQVFLSSLVEAKLDDEREVLVAEAEAKVDRAFQLAAFERAAHELINESRLPDAWKDGLRERFSLTESRPTPELDVTDEVSGDGEVVKPALTVLRESVQEHISKEQTRLREASSTRVRQPAPVASLTEARERQREDESGDGGKKADEPTVEPSYWQQVLSEARVPDPKTAYDL